MQDVRSRADIDRIISVFYERTLADPIIGFIFTDIAGIDLEHHLPIIGDFWEDVLFSPGKEKRYQGNTLAVHLALADKVALRPGHFTRWLFLFERAIDSLNEGQQAELMKQRARRVAKSISAALSARKRSDIKITLDEL
jgi:hemoglobin